MDERITMNEAKSDLSATVQLAYASSGFERARLFSIIAAIGAWYGLFSPWGAVKMMILGAAMGRSVNFK